MLPSDDLDSVSRLTYEIIFYIVNDNCLLKISSHFAQIFYIELSTIVINLVSVLSIEPIRNDRSILVKVVKNLISIVLLTRSEDIDLVVERQFGEEFFS